MTATLSTVTSPEIIHLSGISWKTDEHLLEELQDRRLRLTYYRGNLEILSPSPEHELHKKVMGRFVETLAEELEINIYPLRSTPYKHPELSGAEPDECFYIRNIAPIRGRRRLRPGDPPPDLVIEIDITSSSRDRLQVYASLGVPKVWIYDGNALTIQQLQNQEYIFSVNSRFFSNIPIPELAIFLQQAETIDYLELVRMFRDWLKTM
ncbi:Uma2 family endonuclease [Roseofilum sp. Guam]|uniref:Uma2 family endonuclease n=1 Tax=Roseofilum sp. Guam TaxID=2821502 RepID=UPI001B2A8D8F|nr:Uma2 family endonuclease [Roseofilum sp. Guam]MBP0031011.1 Uma2 family endonuclease [Roseofilum sp. Guam]